MNMRIRNNQWHLHMQTFFFMTVYFEIDDIDFKIFLLNI